MSGGYKAYLFSCQSKVRNPCSWRVQASCGTGKIAEQLGYDTDHIKILSSGDVLEINEDGAKVTGRVHVGNVMVDGLGVGDVGNIVLRDRQRLAEDGIIIVVMTLEAGSGQLLAGPDIVSRGFVYVRNSESLMDEAKCVLDDTMERLTRQQCDRLGQDKDRGKGCIGRLCLEGNKEKTDDYTYNYGSVGTAYGF